MVKIPKAELISPEKLLPYPQNIKSHTKAQIAGIAESMKKFGFYAPIVVDEKKIVIIGHGRLEAAKFLKLKEVPIIKENTSIAVFHGDPNPKVCCDPWCKENWK